MGTRHCGIGVESVYGTAVAPTRFFEALSETLQLERNLIDINTIRSRATRAVEKLTELVRGDIEAVANLQELGEPLKAFFGDVTTTGAGPYTHTFPPSTGYADRASWTIELQRDSAALTWRYAGMLCTALGLEFTLEREGLCRTSWVGKSQATGTAASPTFRTLDVVIPSQVAVSFDAAAQVARSFSLNCSRPTNEPFKLGAIDFAEKPQDSDVIAVTGDIELYVNDLTTFYNKFANYSDVDIAVVITGAAADSLTINMNKCKFEQATPHVDGRNRLVVTVPFRSYFDATATENLQMILVNDQQTVP